VRVGLEDNIWYDYGRTQLARNIDLLKRIHILADANGRKIMSSDEFRKKLHLEPGNGKYGRNYKKTKVNDTEKPRKEQDLNA
jgi:3-keto-5-aminohexanoate cleavage enzyme